jgi:surfeit locus 1 family protein
VLLEPPVTRRWWLRPKWMVGHLLCLTLVVLFVNLGFWQLRRADERQARSDLIEARMAEAPVPLATVLGMDDDPSFRRVQTSGRWSAEDTVLVRSRALEGRPGYHVVTPLLLDDGRAVLVNRGFAPLGADEATVLDAVRVGERGTVQVAGVLRPSETRGGIGPREPEEGVLRVVNRIDVDRLQRQVDRPLPPFFLQLTDPAPPPGELPVVLPLPATDDGPHLSYAVQWFLFAGVGAVGWPLLLRKTARDQDKAGDDGGDATDGG